jgi:hypothetical protein
VTPALYHYTCDHGADGIRRDGLIRPHPSLALDVELVWLTDLDAPYREALGLTSHLLSCDRTAHRFEVATEGALWWPRYARTLPPGTRCALESSYGAMPAHWWVATTSVPLAARRAAS